MTSDLPTSPDAHRPSPKQPATWASLGLARGRYLKQPGSFVVFEGINSLPSDGDSVLTEKRQQQRQDCTSFTAHVQTRYRCSPGLLGATSFVPGVGLGDGEVDG